MSLSNLVVIGLFPDHDAMKRAHHVLSELSAEENREDDVLVTPEIVKIPQVDAEEFRRAAVELIAFDDGRLVATGEDGILPAVTRVVLALNGRVTIYSADDYRGTGLGRPS